MKMIRFILFCVMALVGFTAQADGISEGFTGPGSSTYVQSAQSDTCGGMCHAVPQPVNHERSTGGAVAATLKETLSRDAWEDYRVNTVAIRGVSGGDSIGISKT